MIKEYSGIRIAGLRNRKADQDETGADVAARLAGGFIHDCHVAAEDIKILIYVTQSPLFMTPSTSFYIAKELQLGQECYQYDINQGATGMLSGVQLVASLMESLDAADKGLLLMADDELEGDCGKRAMASALLLEKRDGIDTGIYVQNCSLGNSFSQYYQRDNKDVLHQDEKFLSLGQEVLEKKTEEMLQQCMEKGIVVESRICLQEYDSAVRLPMYLEKEQIEGCTMLGAFGAGISVMTLVCDLKKDIYK